MCTFILLFGELRVLEHQRRFSPRVHCTIAIFELVRPFDHVMIMMPWKFRDDISKRPGVFVLTDKHTDRQTDTTEHNTTLAARVVNIVVCGTVSAEGGCGR